MKEEAESDHDHRTPYERFEDLAKQVLTVPKQEIDKKLAEYEAKREPIRRKRKNSKKNS